MTDSNETSARQLPVLPRWKCHKEVDAAKILTIEMAPADQERRFAGGDWLLRMEGGETVVVGHEAYVNRHNPKVGGYYVRYADGYDSYSPAAAFEEGYAPLLNQGGAPLSEAKAGGVSESTIALQSLAPRVTPADIEANIESEWCFTAAQGASFAAVGRHDKPIPDPLSLLTFCVLLLRNGFTVVGQSACASPANFDAEIGRRIARADAVRQVWPLMGYELRSTLHRLEQLGNGAA